MTIEERKMMNAEFYPASVLDWLNEITDEIYADFESCICSNCRYFDMHKDIDSNGNFGFCNHSDTEVYGIVDISFGCNKFELRM